MLEQKRTLSEKAHSTCISCNYFENRTLIVMCIVASSQLIAKRRMREHEILEFRSEYLTYHDYEKIHH